jgi:hypothetical protein
LHLKESEKRLRQLPCLIAARSENVDPKWAKSRMLALLPNRAADRSENDDASPTQSRIDTCFPVILDEQVTLIPEPMRVRLRRDNVLPMFMKSSVLTADPKRPKVRIDKDVPRDAVFKTEHTPLWRMTPKTESADPIRRNELADSLSCPVCDCARMEREDPQTTKSKIEQAEDRRAKLRTENEEPKRLTPRTEHIPSLPIRIYPIAEQDEPSRARFRNDNELPNET